jgi:hypothetical protein
MPYMCFSYPDSVSGRDSAQPDLRRMPFMCFSYPVGLPRRMPFSCFSYSADAPLSIGSDIAEPGLGDPRRMPHTCFRY